MLGLATIVIITTVNLDKQDVGIYPLGPNMGKSSCALHLDPQMTSSPLPHASHALPLVAPAVAIPTTMAPTVGHELSSHRSVVRPQSPIDQQISIGRLVATGSFLHVLLNSYRPASALITSTFMLPVGRINLFIWSHQHHHPL
jgi:hypothetical protein